MAVEMRNADEAKKRSMGEGMFFGIFFLCSLFLSFCMAIYRCVREGFRERKEREIWLGRFLHGVIRE